MRLRVGYHGTIYNHPINHIKHKLNTMFHFPGSPRGLAPTRTQLVSAILLLAAVLAFRMLEVLQFNEHRDKWSPVWIILATNWRMWNLHQLHRQVLHWICILHIFYRLIYRHTSPTFLRSSYFGRHPIESHCSLSLVFHLKFTHGLLSVPCGARSPWVWAAMGPGHDLLWQCLQYCC